MFNKVLASAAILLNACGSADAGDASERPTPKAAATLFAPDDLNQAGRVTLSPAFSPDGQTIYFTQADCPRIWECPQLLMRSAKSESGWSKPELVELPQSGTRVDWPSVSPDGDTLLFSWASKRERHSGRAVYEDFDLFRLDLTDPDAVPQAIDEPDINRIRGGKVRTLRFVNNETAPVITTSGDLYYWTERLESRGQRKVYLARADGAGGFRKAEPLPAPINLPDSDSASWLTANGRLMILSTGRGGDGQSDLYVSVLSAGAWSDPEPLGPVVNSRYADFAGRISPDGKTLVFTSDRPARGGEAGLLQVWQVPVSAVPILGRAMKRAGL